LLTDLETITQDEFLYGHLLVSVKDQLRNKYSQSVSWEDRVVLQHEVENVLERKGVLGDVFPIALYKEVMINVEKELFYLQELLPVIIADNNGDLREDFLVNSGLDRFYVEELENDYLVRHGLEDASLDGLRKGS